MIGKGEVWLEVKFRFFAFDRFRVIARGWADLRLSERESREGGFRFFARQRASLGTCLGQVSGIRYCITR